MSLVLAMFVFSASMSLTPGPVNLITLSSGVNYGFKSTMPFVSGATIGFILLLFMIGMGISVVSEQLPSFMEILRYAGSGFICYLGIKIARSSVKLETKEKQCPTFLQGALLQWLNPKAWMACVAGISAFNVGQSMSQLGLFLGIYFLVCYFCIAMWALLGHQVKGWLSDSQNIKIFNVMMGFTLICVAVYLLFI